MPLSRWRTYRERVRQKRMALRMLALSGVVRPSHVELRYTIPLLKAGAGAGSLVQKPAARRSLPAASALSAARKTTGTPLLRWLREGLTAPL